MDSPKVEFPFFACLTSMTWHLNCGGECHAQVNEIKYVKTGEGTIAGIAQLGERQTEDLKVACSIHAHRILLVFAIFLLFTLSFHSCHFEILLSHSPHLLFLQSSCC